MKIPDGTAAVCAEMISFGENRSLELAPGRQKSIAGAAALSGMSQKTYEMVWSILCVFTEGVFLSQEIGCGTVKPVPRQFCF